MYNPLFIFSTATKMGLLKVDTHLKKFFKTKTKISSSGSLI